jgi:hypothetical protein
MTPYVEVRVLPTRKSRKSIRLTAAAASVDRTASCRCKRVRPAFGFPHCAQKSGLLACGMG